MLRMIRLHGSLNVWPVKARAYSGKHRILGWWETGMRCWLKRMENSLRTSVMTTISNRILRLNSCELTLDTQAAFTYAAVTFHDEVTGTSWQPALAPPVEEGWQTVLQSFASRRTILPSFTMYRTADLLAMGGYKQNIGVGADWAAWLPLALRGKVRQPLARLGHYIQHAENLSNAPSDLIEALLRVTRLSDEESLKAGLQKGLRASLQAAGRRWVAQQTAHVLAKQIQLGRFSN